MALALTGLPSSSAFSNAGMLAKRHRAPGASSSTSLSPRMMVSTSSRPSKGILEEDEAKIIYDRAREFAFSDDADVQGSSSLTDEEALLQESRYWLQEIIRLQSGCIAGTVADKEVCENQLEAAEIVARLRYRIDLHEKKLAKRREGSDSVVPWIATELSVGALLIVVAIFWTTLDLGQRHDDIPSLQNYQEWMNVIKEKEYQIFGGW
eukprot:CAMPEP_0172384562 /NCGR_PEP_ID=MMETSP1061-20121228/2303_1 /TAXON_ID=37318 /ORGANISM="Pseudo-nitzschia pungens, Strain cf. pungens" /LENGTH=207 /DNA_ID=CAMNT_0013113225 /DNA_START=199 /DNA_END=822 /DNA_ORIENTATION=+